MLDYRNHPATVEFGEVECCALRKINKSGEHREFIDSFLTETKRVRPRHDWSILTEIFSNTAGMVFIPKSIHRKFYFELALVEREALMKNQNVKLECGHRAQEHIGALEAICVKMAIPAGNN